LKGDVVHDADDLHDLDRQVTASRFSRVALAGNSAIAADRLRKRLKDWRTELKISIRP
jgi:hypothetical protein